MDTKISESRTYNDIVIPAQPARSKRLPSWMHLKIEETDEHKYLVVYSSIHVKHRYTLRPYFTKDHTDDKIIQYLSPMIYRIFLSHLE